MRIKLATETTESQEEQQICIYRIITYRMEQLLNTDFMIKSINSIFTMNH